MKYLYFYIVIGILFTIVYSYYYLEEELPKLRKLGADKRQLRQATIITIVITFLIYPFTLIEILVKGFKKLGRVKK